MKNGLITLLLLLFITACAASEQASPASLPLPTATSSVAFKVLLPRDAIQALDHPPTVAASEAANHIGSLDMVMGVTVEGESRAYPIGLLSRYEVVNDTVGGKAVGVTFCPNCNTGVAFWRTVKDEQGEERALTFGISGKNFEEALVMIDEETGTLWAQSRLAGLEGSLTGVELALLVASQVPWEEWLSNHPDTTLVIDERAPQQAQSFAIPGLPAAGTSETKSNVAGYVVGVASERAAQAYPIEGIAEIGLINEQIEGLSPFVLLSLGEPGAIAAWQRTHEGQILTFVRQGDVLKDQETGSSWDARTGIAQEGALAGAQLESFPIWLTHWLGWVDLYPESGVWEG